MFKEKSTISNIVTSFSYPLKTSVDMIFVIRYGLQDSDLHSVVRIKCSS